MRNRGRPLSRTMIVEHVWDMDYDGLTNIVDVYIRHLRSKIDDKWPTKLIQTVRGIGYMLDMPEQRGQSDLRRSCGDRQPARPDHTRAALPAHADLSRILHHPAVVPRRILPQTLSSLYDSQLRNILNEEWGAVHGYLRIEKGQDQLVLRSRRSGRSPHCRSSEAASICSRIGTALSSKSRPIYEHLGVETPKEIRDSISQQRSDLENEEGPAWRLPI